MIELLRSNDIVLLSLVETLLDENSIPFLLTDQYASSVDGSLGILPRRVLVPAQNILAARHILEDAGIGAELARLL